MHEDIISFLSEPGQQPFFVEMTGVSYCDGGYRIERRNSQITVLEYILQGSGTVTTDGSTFTAGAGDIYLLHRGSSHHYSADAANPWVKVWMNVRGPVADSLVLAYGLAQVNHVRGLDIRAEMERVYEAAQHTSGDIAAFQHLAAQQFHGVLAAIHRSLAGKMEAAAPSEAAALKRCLDEHIEKKLTLAELSAVIYLSPSQAIRIFRKEYGMTPFEYLGRRRIESAELLLRNTNLPIKQIASRLAYADEHYFSNCFRVRTGVSPSRYRLGEERTQPPADADG